LQDGLERIERTATRMTGQIDELLDLTSLQMEGRVELHPTPIELGGLLRRIAEDREGLSGTHHITVALPPHEITGSWDAARLERVIGNLLDNAIKYSEAGSTIQVELREEREDGKRWACVCVRDSGIGIPASDLPHIFERFRRGRNVGSNVMGTGLGLAGCRQIVEQHGGSIGVRSTEGEGSTFTVRLPLPGEEGAR
jgi:signal transduction histidine kinase